MDTPHGREELNVGGACTDVSSHHMTSRGLHLVACKATYHDRYLAHELVNRVYADFGKEAGGTAVVNPSTDAMMVCKYGDVPG